MKPAKKKTTVVDGGGGRLRILSKSFCSHRFMQQFMIFHSTEPRDPYV